MRRFAYKSHCCLDAAPPRVTWRTRHYRASWWWNDFNL